MIQIIKKFKRRKKIFKKNLIFLFILICISLIFIIRLHCSYLNDGHYVSKLEKESLREPFFANKECKHYYFDKKFDMIVARPFFLNEKANLSFIGAIPKIIHTTWKDNQIPHFWNKPFLDCIKKNSDFIFCHWTDNEIVKFLARFYKDFLYIYFSYSHQIQRVDVSKYYILRKYGGFYKDLDIGCKMSFAGLINKSSQIILAEATPFGIVGDFLGGEPNHKFFIQITQNLYWWPAFFIIPYLDIMVGTGPTFLSINYYFTQKTNIQIIDNKDYVHFYFQHYRGSTWHCLDGKIIWYLYTHIYSASAIFLLISLLTYFLIFQF